jgi:hypothetical protein
VFRYDQLHLKLQNNETVNVGIFLSDACLFFARIIQKSINARTGVNDAVSQAASTESVADLVIHSSVTSCGGGDDESAAAAKKLVANLVESKRYAFDAEGEQLLYHVNNNKTMRLLNNDDCRDCVFLTTHRLVKIEAGQPYSRVDLQNVESVEVVRRGTFKWDRLIFTMRDKSEQVVGIWSTGAAQCFAQLIQRRIDHEAAVVTANVIKRAAAKTSGAAVSK